MKHILQPEQIEVARYTSDFLNKEMPHAPDIEVHIEFSYGSAFDGDSLTLHLTDQEIVPLLETIQANASPEFKKHLETSSLHHNLIKQLL